jgi:TPR repeat protein
MASNYLNGTGEAQDIVQAVFWWRKAAEQGDASGLVNLGYSYEKGEGVTIDLAQAIALYRQAAELGDSTALFNLGDCYSDGTGVDKNEIEAYAYYKLAVMSDEAAREKLASLEKKLSPDAILLGLQRARELQEEIDSKAASKKAGK